MPSAYRIGLRVPRGAPKPAFSVRQKPDGAVSIFDVRVSLTSSQKQELWAHFGSPQRARTGGVSPDGTHLWEGMDVAQPGTAEQFKRACHAVPLPWILIGAVP